MERNMTRPITPADLWNLRRVGQPEHVPNTTKAVVSVSDYHDDGKEASVLHLVDRDGTTVEITDRGHPVAMLVRAMPDGLARLEDEGLLRPASGNLLDVKPIKPKPGTRPPSELVSEGRDE